MLVQEEYIMKKIILVLLTVTDFALAAPKPIIICSAQGQVDNDIRIELSGINEDGNVTDILRDATGSKISLNQSEDKRLTWNAEVLSGKLNLHVSLEDGKMEMTNLKTGNKIGATAKIKCDNVEEALIYDRTKRVGFK